MPVKINIKKRKRQGKSKNIYDEVIERYMKDCNEHDIKMVELVNTLLGRTLIADIQGGGITADKVFSHYCTHMVNAITYYVCEYDIELPPTDKELVEIIHKAIKEYTQTLLNSDPETVKMLLITNDLVMIAVNMLDINDEINAFLRKLARATFEFACENRDKIEVKIN